MRGEATGGGAGSSHDVCPSLNDETTRTAAADLLPCLSAASDSHLNCAPLPQCPVSCFISLPRICAPLLKLPVFFYLYPVDSISCLAVSYVVQAPVFSNSLSYALFRVS